MKFFNPRKIDRNWLKLAELDSIRVLPVYPSQAAKPLQCLDNVERHIKENGGTVQFGWIFSCLGNIVLKLTAHAVVKEQSGSLICVTPNEFRTGRLVFAPDDSIDKLIINKHLPQRCICLIENDIISRYVALERELDELRLINSGVVSQSNLQDINQRASELYPYVLKIAKDATGPNHACYCGSNEKRKRCCG